jgi:hypothetical protein
MPTGSGIMKQKGACLSTTETAKQARRKLEHAGFIADDKSGASPSHVNDDTITLPFLAWEFAITLGHNCFD